MTSFIARQEAWVEVNFAVTRSYKDLQSKVSYSLSVTYAPAAGAVTGIVATPTSSPNCAMTS